MRCRRTAVRVKALFLLPAGIFAADVGQDETEEDVTHQHPNAE